MELVYVSLVVSIIAFLLIMLILTLTIGPIQNQILSLYKEIYDKEKQQTPTLNEKEKKTLYEKGCNTQWLLVKYCLKKMEDDGDILDYESIILSMQEKVKNIPRDVADKIYNGEDPIERSS